MRVCVVCSHKDRVSIDRILVRPGGNCAQVARDFSLPYQSVWKHQQHISRQLASAMDKLDQEEEHALLKTLTDMIDITKEVMERNHKEQNDGMTLKSVDSLKGVMDMMVRASANLVQARLAAKELKGYDSGENEQVLQESFRQDLRILSTRELNVLERIRQKLFKQDPSIIAVPEGKKKNWYESTYEDQPKRTKIERSPRSGTNENVQQDCSDEVDSEEVEPKQDHPYKCRPVLPTQLTSTPWEESPLNPRRRY